jgi:hypothetical protein
MTKAQIIALQERIGTKPDGLWGDVSAKRGWLAAGAFWSRDGMHFEATR